VGPVEAVAGACEQPLEIQPDRALPEWLCTKHAQTAQRIGNRQPISRVHNLREQDSYSVRTILPNLLPVVKRW